MRFKHRICQEPAFPSHGHMANACERGNRRVVCRVPARCLKAIGHALSNLDEQLLAVFRLVVRGPEAREAGRLETVALHRLKRHGEQQPVRGLQLREIKHGLVLSMTGREWQQHGQHDFGQ